MQLTTHAPHVRDREVVAADQIDSRGHRRLHDVAGGIGLVDHFERAPAAAGFGRPRRRQLRAGERGGEPLRALEGPSGGVHAGPREERRRDA